MQRGMTEQPIAPAAASHRPSRLAATWWAIAAGVLLLVILLVFIAQNTEMVTIDFLGFNWQQPLGVALLLAAVVGASILVLAGTARILQLRHAAKRQRAPATRLDQ